MQSIYNPSREAVEFKLCNFLVRVIGKSNTKREYKTEIQFGRRGSFLIIGLKLLCMEREMVKVDNFLLHQDMLFVSKYTAMENKFHFFVIFLRESLTIKPWLALNSQ